MNKFFTKIVGACLGLTMAVGVGVAVASNSKEATPVHATGETWASTTDHYTLATSIAEGDQIMIVSTYTTKAMGSQASNNRSAANITKSGTTVSNKTAKASAASSVAMFTVGINTVSNKNYFTFFDGSGYLYDASTSSKNYLRTQDEVTTNGYADWTVSINASGVASITARSASATNKLTMSYNNSSTLFACYSALQTNGGLEIYKKPASKTLSSVAITTNATKTSFYAGDTFDPSGLVLTATYSDNTTANVTSYASYKYGASGIDPTSAGTAITTSTVLNVSDYNGKTIYVLYTENSVTKYASYTIAVESARTITKVETGGDMETKEYYQGDDWDFTGLYLTVTWNKGTPNPTTVNLSDLTKDTDFECDPDDASDLDTIEIYILGEYEGFEFEFTIEGIEISERPTADVLRTASTSLNYSSTSYGNVSNRNSSTASDIASNATWAGTIACNTSKNNALQLNGTTRGIYTTASSLQYVKSITVDFNDANGKNLYFYGSNDAYTGIISSNFGTALATFTSSGTKSVTAGQFKYCYIYSSGAQYMNSITIEWGDLVPTVSLSTTSFNFTEGDSGTLSTTATPANFGGTVTYSFASSDSSVLSASNVSASTNTISFNKSNCSAGSATITVTATYSSQSASATFTVECAAAQRNLTSIAITTASSDTLFEKDAKFTITDLVVTGTFDAAPLSSDVTADCTFKLWDGSSETALTPGTTTLGTAGDFTVRISHSENIHSPAQILTYSISVFETQNFTLGSEGAAGYGSGVTNDFDVTLNSSTSLTSTVDVYSFNFYSNTGMQMNVSNRGNAYIYNTIAVPGKIVRIELTWKQAYAGSTPTIYFSNSYMDEAPASGGIMGTANVTTESIVPASGNNNYFYFNAQTTTGAIVLTSLKVVYIETAAGQVQNFADKYLHMNDYTSSAGYCMNDSDQHYYSDAKTAYGKLTTEQKSAFADNSAAVARLQAWARANGETFDPSAKTFSAVRISPLLDIAGNGNVVAIIVVISMVGLTAIGGYFFIRRRKEN